jgi:probable HAF family extracellular repeat protein
MRSNLYAYLAMLLCTSAASPGFAASLTPLGDLPGGVFESYAHGVSNDGAVVVGSARSASGYEAFRWTSAGGMVGLGDLPGGVFESEALGVSSDGAVVVGYGAVSGGGQQAFRWTSRGGMVSLGGNVATDVNGDGSVVVGWAGYDAFRWTSAGGMVSLGPSGCCGYPNIAFGVSVDGSLVVGLHSFGVVSGEAVLWTSTSGVVRLSGTPGESIIPREARDVSADGSVIVGKGSPFSGLGGAFRWTSDGGAVGLGSPPGASFYSSDAFGVSGDGSVIVGRVNANAAGDEAFRWASGGGMERLWDVLVAQGVDPAADGWTRLTYARDVSADGNAIVGYGTRNGNTEAFIAVVPVELPGDFNLDGTIDAADYVVWRKNSGTPESYNTWRANFGATLGKGVGGSVSHNAVPEPHSLLLFTVTVPSLLGLGRSRSRNLFYCKTSTCQSRRAFSPHTSKGRRST